MNLLVRINCFYVLIFSMVEKVYARSIGLAKKFLLACLLLAGVTGNATPETNYPEAPNWQTNENTQKKTVKAGLLIPDEKRLAAKHGAELAVRQANMKGGYAGFPFELIVKTTSGPWGTSSKKSVSLVFDDEVLAMMGSLDSRNAHLAEQVAAKTKLVFLSAWATEMSLSNAYVPWYFRCVPNEKQQAAALIEEIYFNRNLKKVALIGTDQNDSELAVQTFLKEAKLKIVQTPERFIISASENNPYGILSGIANKKFEAIILIGDNEFASEIIPSLNQLNIDATLFGTFSIIDNQQPKTINWSLPENVIVVASDFWFTEKGIAFQKEFQKEFGYKPGLAAAYAYDGMNVIIEAVKMAKPSLADVIDDREKIIDAFSKMNYKKGVTGDIKFDKNGNRLNSVKLMRIKNRKPVLLETEQDK